MSLNIKVNENYFNVKKSYLFSEIAKRVKEYSAENLDKKIKAGHRRCYPAAARGGC